LQAIFGSLVIALLHQVEHKRTSRPWPNSTLFCFGSLVDKVGNVWFVRQVSSANIQSTAIKAVNKNPGILAGGRDHEPILDVAAYPDDVLAPLLSLR
jgi:hypothetical protein